MPSRRRSTEHIEPINPIESLEPLAEPFQQSWRLPRAIIGIPLAVIGSLCLLCIVSLAILAPRNPPTHKVLSFGTEGHDPGQFYHGAYIAVDGRGNIYEADWDTGHINEFDPAGKLVRQIALGDGTEILGLAAASNGTLYVSYDGIIRRMNADGTEAIIKNDDDHGDPITYVSGIAIGPDGSLAAADNEGNILRIGSDSKFRVVLATAFDLPSFSSRNEVHQGDAPILSYDVPASKADRNISVAVDGSGNIYAIGWTLGTVIKTGAHGESLSKFGKFAWFPTTWLRGQFDFPDGIAVDHYGRIYVADAHSVQVFGPDEKYQYTLAVDSANGVALDAQDNIYVLTYPAPIIKYAALPKP